MSTASLQQNTPAKPFQRSCSGKDGNHASYYIRLEPGSCYVGKSHHQPAFMLATHFCCRSSSVRGDIIDSISPASFIIHNMLLDPSLMMLLRRILLSNGTRLGSAGHATTTIGWHRCQNFYLTYKDGGTDEVCSQVRDSLAQGSPRKINLHFFVRT